MPVGSDRIPSITELAGQMALTPARPAEGRSAELTGGTRLPPPPLIVMPWGTVALEGFLSYPERENRRRASLTVGWPDLSNP
jgi:hypothetical protein